MRATSSFASPASLQISMENNQLNEHKQKLQKRGAEEKHLVSSLNQIITRLKKEITDTNVTPLAPCCLAYARARNRPHV